MNNNKKQTIAVAMATALGVSAMMSPVTTHAQEEDPATNITQERNQQEGTQDDTPVSEQGLPASEQQQEPGTNGLQSGTPAIKPRSNGAFTDAGEANQAIKTALDSYSMSNETTQVELQDFLNREFVDTGKLPSISVSAWNKTEATSDSTGKIELHCALPSSAQFTYDLMIPRLPKAGEVAINETNFPDDVFRQYVSDNFDTVKDGSLSADEIENAKKLTFFKEDTSSITNLTGVSYFINLESLYCTDTQIESLDLSKNTKLQVIQVQANKALKSLIIGANPNLVQLYCYDDVSLKSLDVRQNPNLMRLMCGKTGIENLNLAYNPNLTYLNCHYAPLTSLDVSQNTKLTTIACGYSKLQGLDVSKNVLLDTLQVQQTPFAWINIGNNNTKLWRFLKDDADIVLPVTSNTFDITKAFKGIDADKITITSGGYLNKATGIVSGYQLGVPIHYEYDCGNSKNGKEIQKVTLTPVKNNIQIHINKDLNKTYDGMPVTLNSTDYTISDGIKPDSIVWEEYIGADYIPMTTIPTNTGSYRVTLNVQEKDFYNAGNVNKEFTISQTSNEWINKLTISDWKYGGQPNSPKATAKFGDVVFTYSDSEHGTYTDKVPTGAGTWYVKAAVATTENYTGLEARKSFLIREAEPIIPNQPAEPTNPEEPGQPVKPDNSEKPNQPTTPDKSKDQNKSDIPDNPPGKVETGDTSQSGLLAVLSFLSAGCIAVLLRKRKKHNEA